MTDIINYQLDFLDIGIFDTIHDIPQENPLAQQPHAQQKQTQKQAQKPSQSRPSTHYTDITSLINLLTSSSEIDYQIISDFFLTYRSFISQKSLLKILFLKFQWCLTQIDDNAHEHKQNIGKLSLVRTFVVIRHWLLNYFAEDFISSIQVRQMFISYINSIIHNDLFVQRIISTLKRHWTYCCNKSWDEDVNTDDYLSFETKIGPQKLSKKANRLSTFALNQQRDPTTRNSLVLSTFDKNAIHKLPIPIPTKQAKPAPKAFLNPKNSNLRLSKTILTAPDAPELYVPLSSPTSNKNVIRGTTDFPKDSKPTKFIPPTPVKKMEISIALPPVTKPQSKGLRPLIENWLKTFHLHNSKAKSKDQHVEKFMRSVVSVARPDNESLFKLTTEKFDILSARTIDELEYLVKFHNELLNKHGAQVQSMNNSFSFTIAEKSKENLSGGAVSNIDNMNICECISNINKSVISFQHQFTETDDNRSYISYDSDMSKHDDNADNDIDHDDSSVVIRKKNKTENLREFNFESQNDHDIRAGSIISQSSLSIHQPNVAKEEEKVATEAHMKTDNIVTRPTSNILKSEVQPAENNITRAPSDIMRTETQNTEDTESNDADEENAAEESKIFDDYTECDLEVIKTKDVEVAAETVQDTNAVVHDDISTVQDTEPEVQETLPADIESTHSKSEEEDTDEDFQHVDIKTKESSQQEEQVNLETVDKDSNVTETKASEAETALSQRPNSYSSVNTDSDYDEIESFVSTYEDIEEDDDLESTNPNVIMIEHNEPTTPPHADGIISSTPHTSPIKSIIERVEASKTPTKHRSVVFVTPASEKLDLNRVPTFTRVSPDKHCSYLSKRSNKSYVSYDSTKSKPHISDTSSNSIFSNVKRNQLIRVHGEHDANGDDNELTKAKKNLMQQENSSIKLVEDEDFVIPCPGVDVDALAELAAISDDSFQSDPINAALLKLEGNYASRRKQEQQMHDSSIDSKELQRQVEDLNIRSAKNSARSSIFIDQRRKTKLFSLTPVKQKPISIQSSSKLLLELLIDHKISSDVLSITNSANHISFILNFDSKTLAEQFTLIEKDCLLEIDWKELIELRWEFNNLVSINSWLELLIQNQTIQGIDLCISRFNLTVNWIISEILLTKDKTLRKLTIQRFIHIAQNCYMLQNYSTLMEILLALGSDKILKLKSTWRIIEPGDILIYKNLEKISSPFKNFANLRHELNNVKPSNGCVPFLGLYLSDLIFNKEKNSIKNQLINFNKFRTDARIVRSLIQCVQWSTLYQLEPADEVLSKCLYIKALDEGEMNACLEELGKQE